MMAEALRWASVAGAVAVTRLGALLSLPTVEEVETLLKKAVDEAEYPGQDKPALSMLRFTLVDTKEKLPGLLDCLSIQHFEVHSR